jgi:hypothetical protein
LVGFCDQYTGSVTGVATMLPGDHETQMSKVDRVHVHISDWDALSPLFIARSAGLELDATVSELCSRPDSFLDRAGPIRRPKHGSSSQTVAKKAALQEDRL